jgi:8-oxo-dGTP pyrophosphatase MutT (NUDIX family)
MNSFPLTERQIRQRLAVAETLPLDNPYPDSLLHGAPQPAAVLIPFFRVSGSWQVLFIRRTHNENDRHGGQVAFPGGRKDPDDGGPLATALREAQEETGLNPDDVRVLGRLNDILTISNYQVTPVVGVIPWPYTLKPAPEEVSRIFSIPWDWLSDPANHEVRRRSLPSSDFTLPVIFFRPHAGETLWGASARITLNLISALLPDQESKPIPPR